MTTSSMQKRYMDLFRGSFKAFGHYADELLAAPTLREFFQILSENIVPLLTKSKAFKPLYLQWLKEKSDFKKKYEETEAAAIKEMHQTLDQLRSLLKADDLIDNPLINERLSAVENVLEGQDGHRYVMPPYYEVAYDRLCSLCSCLLQLERIELIKDFGEIIYVKNTKTNPNTSEITIIEEPSFRSFTFAPFRSQLIELNKVFSWDNINHDWAVWEHILLAEWSWQTPPSYFEGKKLEYKDIQACMETSFLVNTHAFWIEMHSIKTGKNQQERAIFFKKDRFIKYVKAILNKVLLYQEIQGDVDTIDEKQISPFSLQLKIKSSELILEVFWLKDMNPEHFIIHTFRDNSSLQQLTQKLLFSNPGEKVKVDNPKSENIAKFFERTNLEGFLEQLFFRRMDQYSAVLKIQVALMKDLPEIDLEELTKNIRSLEKIEGNWFHTKFDSLKGKQL